MQNTSISSKSESLLVLYEFFRKGQFIVNRRYQRKLVWTQQEKISFVDSIYRKYSIPLILLATISDERGEVKYEIIDGLQRLNAVFSFIENEFSIDVNGVQQYFNLDTLATTKSLVDAGILRQRTPVMDRQLCIEMMSSYPMPISYITAESQEIEEIFRRINSFGRQLSEQEVRQAGALGKFSDIVRQLSSEIRGDVSENEEIELGKMNNISLSNIRLPYGIMIDDIFWVKYNIIPRANMRISRDEELIAHIVSYILAGRGYMPRKAALDTLYLQNKIHIDGKEEDVDILINKKGEKFIHDQFMYIITTIRLVLEASKTDFCGLIYNRPDGCHVFRTFQIIFAALYEIMIYQHQKVKDYSHLASLLNNTIQHVSGIDDKSWQSKDRNRSIDAIIGIIKGAFIPNQGDDVAYDDWSFEFENIMKKSQVEGAQYDFKTGFHTLSDGSFNKKLVHKCVEILTAEVNKGPNTSGYVLIGITEGKAINAYQAHYHPASLKQYPGTDLYITGVENEISKYFDNNPDKYVRFIKEEILSSPVSAETMQEIATNLRMFTYCGHSIVLLKLRSKEKAVDYDSNYFERRGNDTQILVNGVEVAGLLQRFPKHHE